MNIYVIMFSDFPYKAFLGDEAGAEALKEQCMRDYFVIHHREFHDDFEEYRLSTFWSVSNIAVSTNLKYRDICTKLNAARCRKCYGDGVVYKGHEKPFPVTCPHCEGTGLTIV